MAAATPPALVKLAPVVVISEAVKSAYGDLSVSTGPIGPCQLVCR